MLSSKTIKCLSYLNFGYNIFVIPYRIIITQDKQNQSKFLANVAFGNFYQGLLQKCVIYGQISVHFIVAGLTLIYDIIYGSYHERQHRYIGYVLISCTIAFGTMGIMALRCSKEIALFKLQYLEFNQNSGNRVFCLGIQHKISTVVSPCTLL